MQNENEIVVRITTKAGLELETYTVDCGDWKPFKVAAEIRHNTEHAYDCKADKK